MRKKTNIRASSRFSFSEEIHVPQGAHALFFPFFVIMSRRMLSSGRQLNPIFFFLSRGRRLCISGHTKAATFPLSLAAEAFGSIRVSERAPGETKKIKRISPPTTRIRAQKTTQRAHSFTIHIYRERAYTQTRTRTHIK